MSEDNVRYITTLKEMRVMNDPYRREIMTAMRLLGKPATAKEIADFMGEPPSKVNYHVGILHKYEVVHLDHTETINGIIAKFFGLSNSIFKIKMEGKNPKSKEILAVRELVSSTFDSARDVFTGQIDRIVDSDEEDCEKKKEETTFEDDLLFSRKVYMDDNDLAEISALVDRLAAGKKEGKKLYNFFASYVELKEQNKEKK